MIHARLTKAISPIPPYNPGTPKINQSAPVAIRAEVHINIAVDDPTHMAEGHCVGDLAEVAPDEVRGEAVRVLLDEVEQVLCGRRVRVGDGVQGGQRGW